MNLSIGLSLTRPSGPLGFTPASLFASGEEGAWYDPSDLTTLYQDAAGTTPVTGTGQPVGLMLDKSKGLTLGSEVLPNGTFDTATGWTENTWVISGGVAKHPAGAAISYLTSQSGLLTVGGWYQITLDVLEADSQNYVVLYQSGGVRTFNAPGSYSLIRQATDTYIRFRGVNNTGTAEATIDNISIKELPGNHATQATPTARPTLQTSGGLYYLDFDGVDDVMVSSSFTIISTPITACMAGQVAGLGHCFFDGQNANEFSLRTLSVGSDNLRFLTGEVGSSILGLISYNQNYVFRCLSNGASSALAIDGSETVAGSALTDADVTAWTLGAAGSLAAKLDGRIYGFVAVDRTLTSGEIDDVESYLAAKSGVTL